MQPLSTLKLRDNNIESLPELHSVNTTLKTLDIGENQLQSIPEDVRAGARSGTPGDHASTWQSAPVTDSFLQFFSFLPAMSSLRLTCNSLTSLPDSIASLTYVIRARLLLDVRADPRVQVSEGAGA